MFSWNPLRLNRRTFLKMSALWSTAAALSVPVVPRESWADTAPGEFDVVVIGSGLGGLSCAGYLAKNGFKVVVLEHHDKPGGYATTFTRDEGRFTFDVSLHQTVVAGSTKQILEDLGVLEKVSFVPVPDLFRYISDSIDITLPAGDSKAFEQILGDKFPSQRKGIKAFVNEMMGLSNEVDTLFNQKKLGLVDKASFPVRYPLMWKARKMSLADYLNETLSDPRLKSILSVFTGRYGLPPDKLSGFYFMIATAGSLRHKGSYAKGGSQAISDAIVDFIEDHGGELRFGTQVDHLLFSGENAAGVKTTAGEEISAKAVVANCSAANLFRSMMDPSRLPKSYQKKLQSYRPSISTFLIWLALDRDVTDRIKQANISITDEVDPDKSFEYSLKAQLDKANFGVCIYNNMVKEYSPPGTTVLTITSLCGFEPWKPFVEDYWAGKKTEYNKKKGELAQTLIRRLEKRLIPGLSDMIAVKVAATPLTNIRYTLNTAGAIYGYEQSLANSFMNRISNRTPIKGLYLAGAWGEPGGGYAPVLMSGRKTFGMLMENR